MSMDAKKNASQGNCSQRQDNIVVPISMLSSISDLLIP